MMRIIKPKELENNQRFLKYEKRKVKNKLAI